MSDLAMRGPTAIRHLIADWLAADLPVRMPKIRAAWGLDEQLLPLPERYDAREPLTLDVWPVVSVVTSRHTVAPLADTSELGGSQWAVTYPVRLFVWVRDEGVDRTLDLRDDYLSVLQIAVLASRTLGGFGGGNLTVLPPVEVDFSGVDPAGGERFIAGGFVGFSVRATETLSSGLAHPQSPEGLTVSAVTVQGAVLPTDPALYPRNAR